MGKDEARRALHASCGLRLKVVVVVVDDGGGDGGRKKRQWNAMGWRSVNGERCATCATTRHRIKEAVE